MTLAWIAILPPAMRRSIERQGRFSLFCALGLTACTSSSAPGNGTCTSTQTISAASFDQSCVSDLDCVAVGQGSVCLPCEIACPSAAINKSAMAAYKAVVAASSPAAPSLTCNCPEYGNPCCRQGQCAETCDDEITDLDACAAAGGTCVPYASLLAGGPGCVRISYCAPNPNVPALMLSVCCAAAAIADGGVADAMGEQ